MENNKIIKGEKVVLRPMNEEDFPTLFKWLSDPEVMQYWYGRDKLRDIDWIKKHFTPAIKGEKPWNYWMIEVDGKPVGYMDNIVEKDDDGEPFGTVELDMLIGEKSEWEKGYGTDALRAMIKYSFEALGAERVFLVPRTINPRAIHVYEKVGFKKEGVLRHREKFEGKWIDGVMMSIIREEYLLA